MRQGVVFSIIVMLGVSCFADTLIVDLNGAGDYLTIQSAIDAAQDGDTVLVRDGIYTGDGNRDMDFLGKAITVKSENGPESCIIDCQGTEQERHRGFIFKSGETLDSVLSGFTIINGYGFEETFITDSGDGIVTSLGGGIYSKNASPVISNCIFKDCFAIDGGGICCVSGAPIVINSTFKSNKGGTAAIRSDECSITIKNCHFIANDSTQYAIILPPDSEPIAIEGAGAIFLYDGTADISNCLFLGNTGVNSGVATIINTKSSFDNCTFVSNRAQYYGSLTGFFIGKWEEYMSDKLFSANNCIFWENYNFNGPDLLDGMGYGVDPESGQAFFGPIYEINYSCVQMLDPNLPGTSNIDANPLFLQPGYWDANGTPADWSDDLWSNGDYHLQIDSPCIDAGDPNYVPLSSETDLDGNARLVSSAVDMGCYEFPPPIEAIEVAAKLTPQSINRNSKQPHVIGRLELAGFSEANIDPNEPMVLMPGDIAAECVEVLPGKNGSDSITLVGFFDHAALIEAIDSDSHGQAELNRATRDELEITLTTKLLSGQWVYGRDRVKVK